MFLNFLVLSLWKLRLWNTKKYFSVNPVQKPKNNLILLQTMEGVRLDYVMTKPCQQLEFLGCIKMNWRCHLGGIRCKMPGARKILNQAGTANFYNATPIF